MVRTLVLACSFSFSGVILVQDISTIFSNDISPAYKDTRTIDAVDYTGFTPLYEGSLLSEADATETVL